MAGSSFGNFIVVTVPINAMSIYMDSSILGPSNP
jgi:hypothetical protein